MGSATWDVAVIVVLSIFALLAAGVWIRDAYRFYRNNKPGKRGATYIKKPPVRDSRSSLEYSKPHMPNSKRYG